MNRTTTREDVLRRVVTELDDRRDGILPMHLAGVSEHFDDTTHLLGAVQLRWYATLSGLVEREVAADPLDREDAVVTAWALARDTHPGVRAALDGAAGHPADAEMAGNLRRAAAKEHVLLAVMAGAAGLHDPAAPAIGRDLERRARAVRTRGAVRPREVGPVRSGGSASGRRRQVAELVGRVRHLVA